MAIGIRAREPGDEREVRDQAIHRAEHRRAQPTAGYVAVIVMDLGPQLRGSLVVLGRHVAARSSLAVGSGSPSCTVAGGRSPSVWTAGRSMVPAAPTASALMFLNSTTVSRLGRRLAETMNVINAKRKTTMLVQSLSRRPRMWFAWSTRRYSIQLRPAT